MTFEIKHDPGVMVATAEKRLVTIANIFERNQVYLRPNPRGQVLTRVLARLLVGRSRIIGEENLEEAKKMSPGGVLYIGNHHSNADTPARREVFTRQGLKVVVDSTIYLAGLNVAESSPHLFPSERAIQVISPRDVEAAKWVQRNATKLGLPKDQAEIILQYLKAAAALNNAAFKESAKKLDEGFDLFFYPEATRSRDKQGRMGRAHVGLSSYLQDDDRLVVPIYENGAQRILPPGWKTKNIPGSLLRIILLGGYPVEIIVGKPVKVGELKDIAGHFLRRDGNVADAAMYQLWQLKPNQVMPECFELFNRIAAVYGDKSIS